MYRTMMIDKRNIPSAMLGPRTLFAQLFAVVACVLCRIDRAARFRCQFLCRKSGR